MAEQKKNYHINGNIISNKNGISTFHSIDGFFPVDKKGNIEGELTISGIYKPKRCVFGYCKMEEDHAVLILRFPEECFVGDYVSTNGSTPEDLAGEYIGSWHSFNGIEFGEFVHNFSGQNKPTTRIEIRKISDEEMKYGQIHNIYTMPSNKKETAEKRFSFGSIFNIFLE